MTLSSRQSSFLAALVAVLLVSMSIAAWGVAKWGFGGTGKSRAARTITVSDSAQAKAMPDTAFITFGVENRSKNADAAARANAAKSTAVIAAIVKAGIAKSDVKTIDYSLEPQMNWEKSPPTVVGYSASNTVSVRTKDMGKIGSLIDAAIAAGANNVRGVRFDIEDKRALRAKALALAVKKAEGKAAAIARALGAGLGAAVSASESVDEYQPYSRNFAAADIKLREVATPISPGETSVSAQVKVVYAIR